MHVGPPVADPPEDHAQFSALGLLAAEPSPAFLDHGWNPQLLMLPAEEERDQESTDSEHNRHEALLEVKECAPFGYLPLREGDDLLEVFAEAGLDLL